MHLNKVKKITIFGGGTSGWLTAAFLRNNLVVPTEIVLIEDSSKGPIGVGEGTQPLTAKFLTQCGILPHMWMKQSQATFKYGVELIGWNDHPYFVDNDNVDNGFIAHDLFTPDYFIDKPYSEFANWHPAYKLAKKNISQKFDPYLDVNYRMGPNDFGAVHFRAYDIIETIKNIIIDDITYIDTNIVDVNSNENGITALLDSNNNIYTSDLFVDCTGFSSRLLEQELGVKFKSYENILLNDSAVVVRTQYTDPVTQCHPYTKATTMKNGWMFTIPTFKSVGNGYVYSSKFVTPDEAEQELREEIQEFVEPAKHLQMKCGYHKEIAVGNVCAVGLSAGFIEPLEATGITFTTSVVANLAETLNRSGNVWGSSQKRNINDAFYFMSNEILAFVWAHYHWSSRNDTEYWNTIRQQNVDILPELSQEIIDQFLPRPGRFFNLSPYSMFNVVQWFSVLHAGGAYQDIESNLTETQKQYAEYFCATQTERLKIAEQLFDNHYNFLSNWYSQ